MANKIELAGEVFKVGEEQTFSRGFRKRELVIVQGKDTEYPNYIPITFTKERCDELETLALGDKVTVTAYLGGRKWARDPGDTPRFFLSLDAAKIDVTERVQRIAVATPDPATPPESVGEDDGLQDNLPF